MVPARDKKTWRLRLKLLFPDIGLLPPWSGAGMIERTKRKENDCGSFDEMTAMVQERPGKLPRNPGYGFFNHSGYS